MKKESIKSNPLAVQYIEDLEDELAKLAVNLLWNSLKFIKSPSYEVQKEAINTRGWAIQFIENPSEELCLLAVEKDYDSIKYIENPSEEVEIKAIENSWQAIKYIKEPSLRLKRKAIIQDEEAIHFIRRYGIDELKIFIGDNIKIVKYIYESIEPELVIEVLVKKLQDDKFTNQYMKDFIDLEILEMDKVKLVLEYGTKREKKLLVDYKLSK